MREINFYKKPHDIKTLEKMYPVTKSIFSARLIESRMHLMNEETKARAKRTIYCLQTGEYWNVRVQL